MKIYAQILLSLGAAALVACTATTHQNRRGDAAAGGGSGPGEAAADSSADGSAAKELKLKSTDILAQSIFAALGPGKTLKKSDGAGTRDLMADFSRNFGGTTSLRLGEVYADSPSVAYILALGIVGTNAGAVCKDQLAKKDPEGDKCRCDDAPSANAMISRALPFLDMDTDDSRGLVDELTAQCLKDPAAAVSSLISSLAFAARI